MVTNVSVLDTAYFAGLDILGAIWLASAFGKFRDLAGFADASAALLPRRLHAAVPPGARALPVLEACLGLLLLAHAGTAPALAASAVLLTGFVVVLLRARRAGVTTSCACFGSRSGPIDLVTVVRTGVIGVLALLLLARLATAGRRPPATVQELGYAAFLAALALAAAAVGLAATRLLTTVETTLRTGIRAGGAPR